MNQIIDIALLVFGFGFVIFWHELGHFLAAKYVGIKVEQFAVGFGQALFSWRKGLGLRFGSSQKEFASKVAAGATDVSETEYRLNWIPLGGYVKMLGQDDMDPNAQSADPRAFNRKSIPARMLVVSAGVIMNVILAGILFMVLFLHGFTAPAPIVGNVVPGSPADKAGMQVGDRVMTLDGAVMHDFTKIQLATALTEEDGPTPLVLKRGGSAQQQVIVRSKKPAGPDDLLMLGIAPGYELRGIDPKKAKPVLEQIKPELFGEGMLSVQPGDTIVSANGVAFRDPEHLSVDEKAAELAKFDGVIQQSGGKPIELVVRDPAGKTRTEIVPVTFGGSFDGMGKDARSRLLIAGLAPRCAVESVLQDTPAEGKLQPGDVIVAVESAGTKVENPAGRTLTDFLNKAGEDDANVVFTVLRNGQEQTVEIIPGEKIKDAQGKSRRGVGVGLGFDDQHPVVAEIAERSPAAAAGIPAGATIVSINGEPVKNWFDIRRQFESAEAGKPVEIITAEKPEPYTLTLSADQIANIKSLRYEVSIVMLRELTIERATGNPAIAMWWGVTETRDLILQFYLTIQRMIDGGVSYKNIMGPLGIFHAGSKFASKGTDWLIWFLAMISANLAVVNFLPIPIVDGGLFLFLILEKIMGRPLSPKAQVVAQYVGLALLLSVFLIATYQDIARMF